MLVSRMGSGKTAHECRIFCAFAGHLCVRNQNILSRLVDMLLSLYVADSLVVSKCKPDRIEINLKKQFLLHIPFC